MKKLTFGTWIALVFLACAGLAWWILGHTPKLAPSTQTPASVTHSAPNAPVDTRIIPRVVASKPTPSLWQAYAVARQKALQQNPELATEYKQMQAEMDAQRKRLEAAIIRADPKTAPIIAKYHAMRERRMALRDAAPKSANSPGNLSK